MIDDKMLKEQIMNSVDDSFLPDFRNDIKLKAQNFKPAKTPWYKKKVTIALGSTLLAGACACAIIIPLVSGEEPIDPPVLTPSQAYKKMDDTETIAYSLMHADKIFNVAETIYGPNKKNLAKEYTGNDVTQYFETAITYINPCMPGIEMLLKQDYSLMESVKVEGNTFTYASSKLALDESYSENDYVINGTYTFNDVNYPVKVTKTNKADTEGFDYALNVSLENEQYLNITNSFTRTTQSVTTRWVYDYKKGDDNFKLALTYLLSDVTGLDFKIYGTSDKLVTSGLGDLNGKISANEDLVKIVLTSPFPVTFTIQITEDGYHYTSTDYPDFAFDGKK